MRRKRAAGLRAGFTILEVLVVIALILILAAQMFSAMTRAKGKSRCTVCKSNLRQLGIGLRMYLDDSGGAYPYVESVRAHNARRYASWFDALGPCSRSPRWGEGVFKCPAYKGVFFEGESKVNSRGDLTAIFPPCGSYAYNASGRRSAIYRVSEVVSPGLGFSMCDGVPFTRPVRESDVKAPADLYVLGDAPVVTGLWGTLSMFRLGGAADYNSFAGEYPPVTDPQHQGVFNMLYADTHAESVKTSVLLGLDPAFRCRWNHDHMP